MAKSKNRPTAYERLGAQERFVMAVDEPSETERGTGGFGSTTQDIYGWHIIHTETGIGYGFCSADDVTEEDLWKDFDPDEFTLVPLVVAGGYQ